MEEFKPLETANKTQTNSEKRYDAVNTESGNVAPKRFWARTKEALFTNGSSGGSLFEYLWFDILIPSAKDTVVNLFKNGVDTVFYGGATSNRNSGYSQTSYGSYYNRSRSQNNYQQPISWSNQAPDYRTVTFETYGKATYALQQLQDATGRYGYARVGDLLDLANIVPDPIDYKHGWGDLRNSRVVPAGGGRYRIELPVPAAID